MGRYRQYGPCENGFGDAMHSCTLNLYLAPNNTTMTRHVLKSYIPRLDDEASS